MEVSYEFYLEAKQKLAEGCFNLRKFCPNSRELKQIVTKELQEDISNENCILHSGIGLIKKLFLASKICEKIQ